MAVWILNVLVDVAAQPTMASCQPPPSLASCCGLQNMAKQQQWSHEKKAVLQHHLCGLPNIAAYADQDVHVWSAL